MVDAALIQQAEERDMRALAQRRDINRVAMSKKAKTLFDSLREGIIGIGDDIIELAESK